MVNPIPVNIPTPYKFNQFEFVGICANPNLIDVYENIKTPNCLPKNNPSKIPRGTGDVNDEKDNPSSDTPALAKAKIGIIKYTT